MITIEEVVNMTINLSMRASQAEAKVKELDEKNKKLEAKVKELEGAKLKEAE